MQTSVSGCKGKLNCLEAAFERSMGNYSKLKQKLFVFPLDVFLFHHCSFSYQPEVYSHFYTAERKAKWGQCYLTRVWVFG